MNADLIAKYDGLRVPRYTSFPTAPHFGPQVQAGDYLAWLGRLPAGQELSLYFHVPFCKSMCWYCGCHTKIVARYDPIAEYLDLLMREIDLVADALPGAMPVRHVHFGGGTPTMIGSADFERLMAHVRSRFDLVPGCEIAVEIDPRTLTLEAPEALARAGVNRASLGVQDLDATVQSAINRVQPFEVTEAAVRALRRNGIDSINLDLMYGLPHQTPESCEESAERVMDLTPERLAVFGYAHVPWMKKHQRLIDESVLADARDRWKQFDAIAAVLADNGYHQIGLDHFALEADPITVAQRNGTLRRNFQGYTTDGADVLIGFGASSIGALPDGYVQNDPALERYAEAVRAGRPPIVKGKRLSADDRLRRDLIERLMCDLSVDLDAVAARHGVASDLFEPDLEKLAPLAADGLARVDGHRITVPDEVRPLVRAVAAAFDPYLDTAAMRHSKAI
ncbi:oxygen-independent coproporphyrinogen III oxidase [Skermanella sp. TT6]|uniref:Coproporphyrinogen-III oxidase n=1 Tax=Skermanella cutis TaxID=2775420 RepID=A0ABX7BB89_9PROT|nr:oxygen-independent coproporphyrinogen III oxidase [Skermanella sp. TT6]QQP91659.1 oxygen-independent coproporphyrinogen III oxidase [Skermanella sp. TT6]